MRIYCLNKKIRKICVRDQTVKMDLSSLMTFRYQDYLNIRKSILQHLPELTPSIYALIIIITIDNIFIKSKRTKIIPPVCEQVRITIINSTLVRSFEILNEF